MIKLENHHCTNPSDTIDSGRDYQWMAKPLGVRLLVNLRDNLLLIKEKAYL